MAIERKWLAITATPLTADGTSTGIVTVADTAGFKTKQHAYLLSNTKAPAQFQVQEVLSPTQLVLGPIGPKVGRGAFSDLSGYTLADNAVIGAPEQDKAANPPDKDHYSAVYESDPVVADRVILVDQYGRLFGDANPLPVAFQGSISIGSVEIKDADGDELAVNPDGSINVNIVPSTGGSNVVRNRFDSIVALDAGTLTPIVSYTVPSGKIALLQKATASGDNIAKYQLFINGNPQDTFRTYFGGSLNALFDFTTGQDNGLTLVAGDVVAIQVIHDRPSPADFEGRIQVYEVTL